jgi:peptide/nickel transport system ATP-binding protein
VSALDVSIQAQILMLVMYFGRIVESASHATLWREPRHPYTKALFAAVPSADPGHKRAAPPIKGELVATDMVTGCRFHSRCPAATDRCRVEEPKLRPLGEGHHAACHYA